MLYYASGCYRNLGGLDLARPGALIAAALDLGDVSHKWSQATYSASITLVLNHNASRIQDH